MADEAIAPPRKGFDETRLVGVVAQSVPQLFDGGVQAVVEVHKSIRGPESFLELFPGDNLAGLL